LAALPLMPGNSCYARQTLAKGSPEIIICVSQV
jgi:hypothetical protein